MGPCDIRSTLAYRTFGKIYACRLSYHLSRLVVMEAPCKGWRELATISCQVIRSRQNSISWQDKTSSTGIKWVGRIEWPHSTKVPCYHMNTARSFTYSSLGLIHDALPRDFSTYFEVRSASASYPDMITVRSRSNLLISLNGHNCNQWREVPWGSVSCCNLSHARKFPEVTPHVHIENIPPGYGATR